MNGIEKSDNVVVPMKLMNKGVNPPAESVEERTLTKGNIHQATAVRTQCRVTTSSGLVDVRKAARTHRKLKFTAPLHHINIDLLRESYYSLKRQSAPGIDGMTWAAYETDLENRLKALHCRVHQGRYRAQPARRVTIPKADGTQRALSIWCVEDKIVQQAVTTVLNAIYEVDFLGISYGFRPGRSQHDALDALTVGLNRRKVNFVLDADIQSFFDTIDHDWLLTFLKHRIGDKRLLRLIRKWLTVGVENDTGRERLDRGAPQGAVISPLLANIYLHYVLDLWAHQWRERNAKGDVIMVRYADDCVLGFQYQAEAKRFQRDMQQRLQQFGLSLHPKKTQLIRFGRFARRDSHQAGQSKPATFDFLGFTHYCTKSRSKGHFIVGRKTIKKRMRSQLAEIKLQLRKRLHDPVGQTGTWLRRVLQGHLNYYAVPGNSRSLRYFFTRVWRYWMRSLRRRSQRHRLSWSRYDQLWARFAPRVLILHAYPARRFDAKYPR